MPDGSARITFDWADGSHTFRLALGQLRELQDKTGVGPAALFERLGSRQWRVDDLRETIRLGLIGGGMEPLDALALVRRYVDERPLLESVEPAWRILMAALSGVLGDPIEGEASGKAPAPETAAETDASPSPPSSAPPL